MSSTRAAHHQGIGHRRAPVFALAGMLVMTVLSAGSPTVVRAETTTVVASADATIRDSNPDTNYPSSPKLAAKRYRAQFFVLFDISAWYGKSTGSLELEMTAVEGDASTLRLRRAGTEWRETGLTWRNRPSVSSTPVMTPTLRGTGRFRVDLGSLFPGGTIDRQLLALQGTATTIDGARVASRESGSGPTLVFAEVAATTLASSNKPVSPNYLRFYTPNIIPSGDHETPARDTDPAQLDALFAREREIAPILGQVDVYGFFGGGIARGDERYRAMVLRAIPMLKKYGVDIGLEVAGPMGYAPPIVTGADRNGENGADSARFDLTQRIARFEEIGGRVDYLMLDGALRRTITNGVHRKPHAAYVTIGTASAGNALTYRARSPGYSGHAIRVQYFAQPNQGSSVAVDGTDITVKLATDGAGLSVSTAAQVKAAVESSPAAMALVSVEVLGGTSAGVVPARGFTALAWGDDGLNFSIREACAELVSYMRTIHAARPRIKFVLLEDVVLWPYDGVAGYASVPYPTSQRPDFRLVWDELVRQLSAAGLLESLVGMHNDGSVEYFDQQIESTNRTADDWYGRVMKQQQQVESSGVAFGQHFNSVFGGNPRYSASASDRYFQERVLHHLTTLERYRRDRRPDLDQMDHFAFDAFMYYPRTITPSTIAYSTDDTYLDSLSLFNSFR